MAKGEDVAMARIRQRRSATDKVCSVTSYLAQYLLSQSLFTTATVRKTKVSHLDSLGNLAQIRWQWLGLKTTTRGPALGNPKKAVLPAQFHCGCQVVSDAAAIDWATARKWLSLK